MRRIEPEWRGERCFIVCGGPSVAGLDLSRLANWHVIVVNTSAFIYPDADYLVFADKRWWTHHKARVISEFRGQPITLTPTGRGDHYWLLQRARIAGLARDPRYLSVHHTTTVAAINLACHLLGWEGDIGLLGLDGQNAEDGRMWHHDPHPAGWHRNPKRYKLHGEALDEVANYINVANRMSTANVRVFNCNPSAAHKMFPHKSFLEMTS